MYGQCWCITHRNTILYTHRQSKMILNKYTRKRAHAYIHKKNKSRRDEVELIKQNDFIILGEHFAGIQNLYKLVLHKING